MEINGNTITLLNGTKLYANGGIIGLSPEGELFEGYDDSLVTYGAVDLTDDELMEIADYMVASWEKVIIDAINRKGCG